jgi:copper chaperone
MTMSSHTFSIPNLSCGHCVRAVTEAVKTADPASVVNADPASKRVDVQSTLPREAVAALLAEAGYAPAPTPA